jgi:DNA-binding XRE family transcriptional regulator
MVSGSGSNLSELRHRRGWSQEMLAAFAGVTPETIVALEDGDLPDSDPALLDRLARTLGASTADLLPDPLDLVLGPLRADPDLVAQLRAFLVAASPDQADHFLSSVADSWRTSLRVALTLARRRL